MRLLTAWMIGLVAASPGAVYGQDCFGDAVCVITEAHEHAVHLFVDNLLSDDLIVIFEVEGQNVRPSVGVPYLAVYPGGRHTFALSLHPQDRRRSWRYGYRVRWRKVVNELGCQERLFCIETEERDRYLDVYVRNEQPFDVTVELDIDADNAVVETAMPHVATYPGDRRTLAFRFRLRSRFIDSRRRFTYRWVYGSLHARHDDTAVYALPYAPGKSYAVMQGYDGAFSHQGKHAIDWDMPERTPVHAARGGVVFDVQDRFVEGGLEDRLKSRANYILIQHDDGTIGNYVHLASNGAFVAVGQRVAQGQVIGVSGNTGYSSGPHLHFEVYTITPSLEHRTIPIRFRVAGEGVVALEEGHTYTASLP